MTVLRPVSGFEATAYAWAGRRIVWTGQLPRTDHARNWHSPWRAPQEKHDPAALRLGAQRLLARLHALPACALLQWLMGQPLPFPLSLAATRLEAARDALTTNDVKALAVSAPRLLGWGPGLTPSGDDLLGGVFFALHHAPRRGWAAPLCQLHRNLRAAARGGATNAISAALLGDLMQGSGYRVLHELLSTLQHGDDKAIDAGAAALLQLGATSGGDLLCGLLLALSTTPEHSPQRTLRRRISKSSHA